MIHDFSKKLEFSLDARQQFDISILKKIYDYADIQKTSAEVDKTGVDYVATLRRGGVINIDAKTREKGASRYWKYGEPELALEIWSAVPTPTNSGKTGWTLDESSQVDYILYTFDSSDTNKFYYLPFQMLRVGFVKHYKDWKKEYPVKRQYSNNWTSEAVFVPASVVIAEINRQMTGIAYYQYSV